VPGNIVKYYLSLFTNLQYKENPSTNVQRNKFGRGRVKARKGETG